MKIVLKIGGSILYNKSLELDSQLLSKYVRVLNTLSKQGHEIAIVIGGGKLARMMIETSKKLSINHAFQDIIGIESARLNALVFIASLSQIAYKKIPRSFEEVITALSSGKIVITGGLQPGQSTNAVSALLAELWEANLLINLSDVKKVYEKDPQKYPDAKSYDVLKIEEFYNLIIKNEESPGNYALFDRVGTEIVKRSNIKLIFAHGENPDNILKIISGEKIGTIIQ